MGTFAAPDISNPDVITDKLRAAANLHQVGSRPYYGNAQGAGVRVPDDAGAQGAPGWYMRRKGKGGFWSYVHDKAFGSSRPWHISADTSTKKWYIYDTFDAPVYEADILAYRHDGRHFSPPTVGWEVYSLYGSPKPGAAPAPTALHVVQDDGTSF